jgi:hypothetical protein
VCGLNVSWLKGANHNDNSNYTKYIIKVNNAQDNYEYDKYEEPCHSKCMNNKGYKAILSQTLEKVGNPSGMLDTL